MQEAFSNGQGVNGAVDVAEGAVEPGRSLLR
jgi:hypothetical protein